MQPIISFVRYIYSGTSKEEFLFCQPLLKTTRAIDVFEMITNFFSKHKLNYKKKLGSLCTDGAPSMLGKSSGFTALIKKEIPDIIITHCFLHRHALASKTLPTNLKEVMTTAVKVVNFIRAKPYITDFSKFYVKKWDLNTKFFFITQKCVGFPEEKL